MNAKLILIAWCFGAVATSAQAETLPIAAQDLAQVSTQADDLGQHLAQIMQDPPLAGEPTVDNNSLDLLNEVTVTATLGRGQTIRESTSSISVITTPEIQRKGARQVGEALRGVPGVVSNQYGAGQDVHSTYFIRGLPTTSTALLIDGRSLNNINQEHVDLAELPVYEIERIEVLKGGATTLYGSTAVGGVINVITRPAPKQFTGSSEITYGSYGFSEYSLRLGGPLTPNFRFSALATTFNSNNDFIYRVERPDGLILSDRRPNGEVNSSSFGLNFDWDLDERSTLRSSSYIRKGNRGISLYALLDNRTAIPVLDDSGCGAQNGTCSANELGINEEVFPRIRLDYFGTALDYQRKLGAGEDSRLQIKLGFDTGFTTESEVEDGTPVEDGTTEVSIFNLRALHDWQISPSYNLTYGLDFVREFGRSFAIDLVEGVFEPIFEAGVSRPSLFALNTVKLSDTLTATLGFRQTFTNTYNSSFNRTDGSSFDPSFGLVWQVSPDLTLRTSWARVYKTPNFNDVFGRGEISGNPEVVPESGSTFDLGADWTPTPAITVRAAFFSNSIENLLGYNRISPAGSFAQDDDLLARGFSEGDLIRVNVPEVQTSGFELSFDWRFAPGWSFFATETYTDARVRQGFKAEADQTQYPLVPFHSGQLGLSYTSVHDLRVSLFANYQGARSVDPYHIGPGLAADPGGNPVANIGFLPVGTLLPGYLTVDLSFQVPLTPNFTIKGLINNLLNTPYERNYGNGGPPINFTVGLESRF